MLMTECVIISFKTYTEKVPATNNVHVIEQMKKIKEISMLRI